MSIIELVRDIWMSKACVKFEERSLDPTKRPPAAILDGTTMSIIELVRDIWMSKACVKLEERSLDPSKGSFIALTTKL